MTTKLDLTNPQAAKAFWGNEHSMLTLEAAKELVGKKIRWTHPVYHENRQWVYESVVGEIITAFEMAKREPCTGYANQAEYWERKRPKTAAAAKQRYVVLDDAGEYTGMFCDTEDGWFTPPAFACSDGDRPVFYELVDTRYFLQPSQEDEGWFVLTDAKYGVVIKFKEHQFNETQRTCVLDNKAMEGLSPAEIARVVREMGDWLLENHPDLVFPSEE